MLRDCDPNTGEADEEGYDDEYVLEEFDISTADFIQPVSVGNFSTSWDEIFENHEDAELEDVFELSSMSSMEEAIEKIIGFLGLTPCEGTTQTPRRQGEELAHSFACRYISRW